MPSGIEREWNCESREVQWRIWLTPADAVAWDRERLDMLDDALWLAALALIGDGTEGPLTLPKTGLPIRLESRRGDRLSGVPSDSQRQASLGIADLNREYADSLPTDAQLAQHSDTTVAVPLCPACSRRTLGVFHTGPCPE